MYRALPAELRYEIIKLVVSNPDKIVHLEPQTLTSGRLRRFLSPAAQGAPPGAWAAWPDRQRYKNRNLMLACKEIYNDSMDLMYTKQKFSFTRLCALQTFLLPMRPETLDHLRHVEVSVGTSEWNMMQAIAALLLKCRFLNVLVIHGLCEVTSSRCVGKYLNTTVNPLASWPVTKKSFDQIQGVKLARDMYPFMYPLFNPIIRKQLRAAAANNANDAAENFENAEGGEKAEAADAGSEMPSASTLAPSKPEEPSPPTYNKAVIKVDHKPVLKEITGIQELMQVLKFTEPARRSGWYAAANLPLPRWAWLQTLTYSLVNRDFNRFDSAKKDDYERQTTIMTAMGEELIKLVAQDTY